VSIEAVNNVINLTLHHHRIPLLTKYLQCTGFTGLKSDIAHLSSCSSHPRTTIKPRTAYTVRAVASQVTSEDKWVAKTLETTLPTTPATPLLDKLRASSLDALSTLRMPTTRVEEFRFTDISPLLSTTLHRPSSPPSIDPPTIQASFSLKSTPAATIVLVDGIPSPSLSTTNPDLLPSGSYIGPLATAPSSIVSITLGSQSRARGGPFATLNGALTEDCTVIYLPAGSCTLGPIHLLHLAITTTSTTTTTGATLSVPRLLVVLDEGASAEVIEEFAPMMVDDKNNGTSPVVVDYFTNSVAEIELDDGASLRHGYVQMEGPSTCHTRTTLVAQGANSRYELSEVSLGGTLSRHDLNVEQLGSETQTVMKNFLLAGNNQLQDLHSKLRMNHPRGEANQVHKCIVTSATGRGVFDGNVKVEKLAQKTDAGQLSRNLLLVHRATVNVKPNLQIVADDVKCTHGCTVSDLSEEELFYLKTRGIDVNTARQMLVYSFGREVVRELRDEVLVKRVEEGVKRALVGEGEVSR